LTRFFNILLETDDDLRRKPDPRLHLELGVLRLINARRLAPLEEILAEMQGGQRPARPDSTLAPALPSRGSAATAHSVSVSSSGPAPAARMAPDASQNLAPARAAVPAPPTSVAPTARTASNTPIPAAPPRVVARAAENASGGLSGAQLEAIKATLQ